MQANATFRLQSGEEKAYSGTYEGAKLTHGGYVVAYTGDLEGEGVLAELKNYAVDGSAWVYGLERVSGTLAGKLGSFVLEHIGRFTNGTLTSRRTVVAGSATGELKNLRGEINFQSAEAEEFAFTLEYYFEADLASMPATGTA